MSGGNNESDATALDAIEYIATKGISGHRRKKRLILLTAMLTTALLILVIVKVPPMVKEHSGQIERLNELEEKFELQEQMIQLEKQRQNEGLPELAEWPVAVFLPSSDSQSIKDNVERQEQGFNLAFEHVGITNTEPFYHFYDYGRIKDTSEQERVIGEFKKLYAAGIRVFVITMSQTALKIRDDFIKWAYPESGQSNPEDLPEGDRPVLVVTVSSAPNIADRKKGVFRHYIRSQDESSVLATYIESLHTPQVGVFYVKDSYGDAAMKSLKKRMPSGSDTEFKPISVRLGQDQANDIQKIVQWISAANRNQSTATAVIIGYGSMIVNILAELEGFRGEILVVSTFTEEGWRPRNQNGELVPPADRVKYVGPIEREDDPNDRGVVFQYSYLTLTRVLHCRDQNDRFVRGAEAFWSTWTNEGLSMPDEFIGEGWADVEFTSNGDSHVSLRLLNVEDD